MEPKGQEVSTDQHRDNQLEEKIDAAKRWVNEPNREARRKAFQRMANLIAKRSPEYIAQLEAQKFGHYL